MTRQRWIPWALAAVAVLLVFLVTELRSSDSSDEVVLDRTTASDGAATLPSTDAMASAEDDGVAASESGDDVQSAADDPQGSPSADGATAAGSSVDGSTDGPAGGAEPGGGTAEPTATPAAAVATPAPSTPARTPASAIAGYRLRVPRLGVSASMIDLGVDESGVMEVPREAQQVAWYRFTAVPGEPGNILLGGHITWHGATAVFRYLEEMTTGDEIYIDTPSGETIKYVVRETWWADPYASSDVSKVIGTRSGAETITLFTCGGTWDTDAREYSHRRVVTAVRA